MERSRISGNGIILHIDHRYFPQAMYPVNRFVYSLFLLRGDSNKLFRYIRFYVKSFTNDLKKVFRNFTFLACIYEFFLYQDYIHPVA